MTGNPLMAMMGGNPMMNSPVMQLIGALRSGNPMPMFQRMIGQNPQMKQIVNSAQGYTPTQKGDYLKTAAQQKGIDLNQLASQLGMPEDVAKKLGISL